MPRVLLSYRREDSAPYAGRLYDHLSEQFGRDNVFMDVTTIRPGQDFFTAIEQSVTACDALVAVIGNKVHRALNRVEVPAPVGADNQLRCRTVRSRGRWLRAETPAGNASKWRLG